ncbi:MAG: hypothetical protein IJU07_09010 [Synergistaceae bacterium]|nr:hypothetical protein [Synergistaceae bacterium]
MSENMCYQSQSEKITDKQMAGDFCCPFGQIQKKGSGLSEKVLGTVAIYQDFDIKGSAHAEKRLLESENEVLDIGITRPVQPSRLRAVCCIGNGITRSGGG